MKGLGNRGGIKALTRTIIVVLTYFALISFLSMRFVAGF